MKVIDVAIYSYFTVFETQHRNFESVLADLRRQQTGKKVILKADRSSLLQGSLPHFKGPGSELSSIDVVLHTERNEEPCTNLGGANREFFTLLLEEFKSPNLDMFEGPGSFLLPVFNRKALTGNLFYFFGKICVLSILADGPGFPYFPPFLVSYLRGREFEHELSSLYIINPLLTEFINQVIHACQCTIKGQMKIHVRFFQYLRITFYLFGISFSYPRTHMYMYCFQ